MYKAFAQVGRRWWFDVLFLRDSVTDTSGAYPSETKFLRILGLSHSAIEDDGHLFRAP
jgi:hypothetical protein